MWFAAMATTDEYPWTFNLAWKLLHNDPNAVAFFTGNPFPAKPPRYIRAVLYRYSFAQPDNLKGLGWNRTRLSVWLPAMSVKDARVIDYLKSEGWIP